MGEPKDIGVWAREIQGPIELGGHDRREAIANSRFEGWESKMSM
jgi:hypothetical protein